VPRAATNWLASCAGLPVAMHAPLAAAWTGAPGMHRATLHPLLRHSSSRGARAQQAGRLTLQIRLPRAAEESQDRSAPPGRCGQALVTTDAARLQKPPQE